MRDAYKGEKAVKTKRDVYLPMTSNQIADGALASIDSAGSRAYNSYLLRARFPNYTREAIQMAIGMMHSQPAQIQVPKSMEKIVSSKGESLQHLLRRINVEQLITGRVGVMADLPTSPEIGRDLPYLTIYSAERIINWDDGAAEQLIPQTLNMVVLDETESVRKNIFDWETKTKYRVLLMGTPELNQSSGTYVQGVFEEKDFAPSLLRPPSWRGRTLNKIPFVIINSADLTNDVDEPPLLDLGSLCMAIYRGEADYRQNLFMQGQDTLVVIGGNFDEDEKVKVGAGTRIDLPMGADAKYIGVQSSGLPEQREAQERLEARASSMGAQTLDTTSRQRESGDSLRIRIAARTADLTQIVDVGAQGLEDILKICAEWMGEDPNEVKIVPNHEFGEAELSGQNMVEISTARNLGWPITARSMHKLAQKRRMTELTFEEEIAQAKLEEEEGFVFRRLMTGDRSPDNQEEETNA